jgi:hypothetical protein
MRPADALILRCHSREPVWPCIEVDRREGRNIPACLSKFISPIYTAFTNEVASVAQSYDRLAELLASKNK